MGKTDGDLDAGLSSSVKLDELSNELGQLNLKNGVRRCSSATEDGEEAVNEVSKSSDEDSSSDNESTTAAAGLAASDSSDTRASKEVPAADDSTDAPVVPPLAADDDSTDAPVVPPLAAADDSTDAPLVIPFPAAALVGDDAGEESDEDNEHVCDGTPAAAGGDRQVAAAASGGADGKEDYQERGPCKVSRLQNSALRYNPMLESAHGAPAADACSTNAGITSPAPAATFNNGAHQPLTPPYDYYSVQDEVLYEGGAGVVGDVSAVQQFESVPGYNTPLYCSPTYASTPTYAPDFAPGTANNAASMGYSGLYDNSSNGSSPSYGGSDVSSPSCDLFPDNIDLEALSAVTQQLGGSLLSPNYLDALEHAVDQSVGERSGNSGDDEDINSNMRYIMESLRSIDPAELDYITPASPALTHDDLEQELALSVVGYGSPCVSPTPPLSPESLPDSPVSLYAADLSGPQQSNCCQDDPAADESAIEALKKLCNEDVIMRAAKRVACQRNEDLCRKDPDGDTCYMIVVCKPSSSPNFYENLFVLQQHLLNLRLCCDTPLASDSSSCHVCGARQRPSPLSDTNNAGDSVLSCALKMRHPAVVVNYLCAGLACSAEDTRRVFDDPDRRSFLVQFTQLYPVLARFV